MANIKEDDKRFVFNSKNVEEITNSINDGFVVKRYKNPWFQNEIGVRRAGVTFDWTEEEIKEYVRCSMDIHYFAEKYCKIKNENGQVTNMTLRDYQKDILDLYTKNRFSILCASRQTGKTINAAITMLHFITFNNDKNIMIVANIRATTIEIIDKIKNIYIQLPFFLKNGIKNWNQQSIIFENGCRIKSAARSRTPAIGYTIDFLYLDEFAHIPSNIIESYYGAAYPTVSSISNSKIIITSTPNGMNLFYRLLTDAERPYGDPLKNSFKAMRVYWWQVEGRFVTYIKLSKIKLSEHGLSSEYVYEKVKEIFEPITKVRKVKMVDSESEKEFIYVYNNDSCPDKLVKSTIIKDENGNDIPLNFVAELSTWKEDAIKDIGGEDKFNQEYDLRFINSARSLLSENIINSLIKEKKNFVFKEIEEMNRRLKFSYKDLLWVDDTSVFSHLDRKEIHGVMSIDISEGLGQDYSVINIFKICPKDDKIIESQKEQYTSISDFFCLEQIGIYRSNYVSVKQLAELFYVLAFEYFNYDNFKVVLEVNNYGNEFLAHLPHLFDGNNNYGSSIFFRYKHRLDALDEKVGLKVGENKNILVKDYQQCMDKKNFKIYNEENIREMTTFVKHITPSGGLRYAADIGHDDTVMTIVNCSSVFTRHDFREMVDYYSKKTLDFNKTNYWNEIIKNVDYKEATDYSSIINVNRRRKYNSEVFNQSLIEWQKGKKMF